jgi:hypothetical protein
MDCRVNTVHDVSKAMHAWAFWYDTNLTWQPSIRELLGTRQGTCQWRGVMYGTLLAAVLKPL